MSKSADKNTKQVNENLLGERFVRFGDKYIYVPSLMKGYLSLRTSNQRYIKDRPAKPISRELKEIFLDIVFKNSFATAKYDQLSEDEQELFDDVCRYSRMTTHDIEKRVSITEKQKNDLIGKFNVLKGELLAGNSNPDLVKKMRNILLELKAKKLIPKQYYDQLISEIVACI
jgi:hypothetical protein